ncbi:MAG: hypothetical protein JEZ12_20575 [Desulfobacterium sp.]|nr:hypothetical protein [Desulfobacterium sp.]
MMPVHLPPAGVSPANSSYNPPAGIRNVKSQGSSPVPQIQRDVPFEMSPVLKEVAATAGVPEDELSFLISNLHGEERSNFLSALGKSGDNARELILTTQTLKGKERATFLDLADTLSEDGLKDFLTAVGNSPKDLTTLLETASSLSSNQLENFMSAAAMADEEVSLLIEKVNTLQEAPGTSREQALSSFLSAASKSGRYVMAFMEKIQEVSEKTGANIIAHINVQPPGEGLDNFILMLEGAGEDAINTAIDISPDLSFQDRDTLFKTASRLGGGLGMFMDKIKTFGSDHPGATATDLSNFITTAGKAGNQIGNFLELSGRIDLALTSKLSTVDTANFLVAADKAGRGNIALLTELTEKLQGTDRSNLLYGAAFSQSDPGDFLSQVDKIESNKRSEFLVSAAHENQDSTGPAIYMKGLLSDKAYEAFNSVARTLDDGHLKTFVDLTNELDETDRDNFLKTASAAGNNIHELFNVVTLVSGADRTEFLEVGSTLKGEELEHFIDGAKTAVLDAPPGTFTKFVGVTRDLSGMDRELFLETSATAKPDVLEGFIDFTRELITKERFAKRAEGENPSPKQLKQTEVTREMRTTFLLAASKAGQNLEGLVDSAEKLVITTRKEPWDFVDIFSAAAATPTEKYLGTFIRTYA